MCLEHAALADLMMIVAMEEMDECLATCHEAELAEAEARSELRGETP